MGAAFCNDCYPCRGDATDYKKPEPETDKSDSEPKPRKLETKKPKPDEEKPEPDKKPMSSLACKAPPLEVFQSNAPASSKGTPSVPLPRFPAQAFKFPPLEVIQFSERIAHKELAQMAPLVPAPPFLAGRQQQLYLVSDALKEALVGELTARCAYERADYAEESCRLFGDTASSELARGAANLAHEAMQSYTADIANLRTVIDAIELEIQTEQWGQLPR